MKVQILVDNPNSWYVPYAQLLVDSIKHLYDSTLIHKHEDVEKGDVLCLIACEKLFTNLKLNANTIVVHESDLPQGKGWSPLTWQILEGKNTIPVTLFEAAEDVDAGEIYDKEYIELTGTELLSEIKHQQGIATNRLIERFLVKYPNNQGEIQKGESSFYPKRTQKDSELDIHKTIADQFNLLRVVDNERYPAYFYIDGQKFILKIEKDE